MTDREAMKQALEVLEWNLPVIEDYGDHEQLNRQHRAITALRERLAQPEQERWVWRNAAIRVGEELSSVGPVGYYDMKAAQWLDWAMAQEPRGKNSMAQPEQEPLQFKCTIVDDAHPNGVPLSQWGKQPEQEPVIGKWSLREVYFDEDGEPISHRSPPQRTWVGLTEEEHKQIQRENWPKDQPRAIEAKLKEKNGGGV